MPLNARYLQELSDLFVAAVKRSDFYQKQPKNQQDDFDIRCAEDVAEGQYPLLPGAEEVDLQKLSEAFRKKLHLQLPSAVLDILRQVDGFIENGVSLYGVDAELRGEEFDSAPGLLAENLVHWSGAPETIQKYLFVGDSDIWQFAVDLETGDPVALHKVTFEEAHRFSTMEELVNDMMQQALGDFPEETEDPESEPGNPAPGFPFSAN
jgi:hypothetical protein